MKHPRPGSVHEAVSEELTALGLLREESLLHDHRQRRNDAAYRLLTAAGIDPDTPATPPWEAAKTHPTPRKSTHP